VNTVKALLVIIILLQTTLIFRIDEINCSDYFYQNTYEVNDPSTAKEVKTIEYILVGEKQGWSNHIQEIVFDEPVMVIGASLISCVSATQGIEILLSTGKHDFSVDTYSNDTMFHLSAIYSQTGGQATATVILPRGFYYYVEAGKVLQVDFFANTLGDGGSFLIYYVPFNDEVK